jgi:hypothetical protein
MAYGGVNQSVMQSSDILWLFLNEISAQNSPLTCASCQIKYEMSRHTIRTPVQDNMTTGVQDNMTKCNMGE